MKKIIDRLLYDTETAEEIASDEYWDGRNRDRNGRNTILYKTKKGNYFAFHKTRWQGELDRIEPLSKEVAMKLYESLEEHEVGYEEAFGVAPEEA